MGLAEVTAEAPQKHVLLHFSLIVGRWHIPKVLSTLHKRVVQTFLQVEAPVEI